MDEVTIEERGWCGHFIGGASCRFRRNTLVSKGDIRIVVSTVGAYVPRSMEGSGEFERIGLHRYYETMAFMARWEKPYWDADVKRQVSLDLEWGLNEDGFEADKKANDMHESHVKWLADMLRAGGEINVASWDDNED